MKILYNQMEIGKFVEFNVRSSIDFNLDFSSKRKIIGFYLYPKSPRINKSESMIYSFDKKIEIPDINFGYGPFIQITKSELDANIENLKKTFCDKVFDVCIKNSTFPCNMFVIGKIYDQEKIFSRTLCLQKINCHRRKFAQNTLDDSTWNDSDILIEYQRLGLQ